jgi:predicted esterase
MDPRGRAKLAMDLFAPAAERFGYVLISSYNTLSDGAIEPNVAAMNAMLEAAQTTIATDLSRLYIAGFSGTARIGWALGREMPEHFAGILAAGAAPMLLDSLSVALLESPGFAYAMTAGSADFNFTEVRGADRMLRVRQIPAAVQYFDGPHGWPPPALIDRSLAWFELRAMLGRKRAMDSTWVRAQIVRDTLRIADLEARGQWLMAADEWQELSLAYAGWPVAAIAKARADSLNDQRSVLTMRKRLGELDTRFSDRNAAMLEALGKVRSDPKVGDPAALAKSLKLDELKRLAASGDSLERPWATRMLASTQAFLGFYEPRQYLEAKEPVRAVLMLETLRLVAPWTPQHCAFLRQAAAMTREELRGSLPVCPD